MKRIYLVLIATIAITFVSCSDQEIDTVKPDAGQVAPIIDLPEGATQGRILVKFKPEAASFLDAATTRSVGAALTRSGISDISGGQSYGRAYSQGGIESLVYYPF